MTGLGLLTRGMLGGASSAGGAGSTVYVVVPVGRLRGRLRASVGRLIGRVRGG